MKKTQFALAALALVASTAAFANGATVYGTIDASVTKSSNDQTAFDGSGNWAGSIFGFTGSEDIEGGLKATYALEVGLNAGTGRMANGGTSGVVSGANNTASSTVFNRQANIGLAGEFGAIKAGLQVSPYIVSVLSSGVATNNESFYVPLFAISGSFAATVDGNANGGVGSTGGFFIPNSVSYSTPSIGGFSATALTALNNPKTTSTSTSTIDSNKYSAYSASYSAGDVRVGAAYENANTNLLTGGTESKNIALSGSYQLGAIGLSAAYIDHKDAVASANDKRTYSLGAAFDASEKIQLSANYAKNNMAASQSLAVVGAQYKLSKTTALYTTIGRGTNGAVALYSGASTTTGTTTSYAVGMYKSF